MGILENARRAIGSIRVSLPIALLSAASCVSSGCAQSSLDDDQLPPGCALERVSTYRPELSAGAGGRVVRSIVGVECDETNLAVENIESVFEGSLSGWSREIRRFPPSPNCRFGSSGRLPPNHFRDSLLVLEVCQTEGGNQDLYLLEIGWESFARIPLDTLLSRGLSSRLSAFCQNGDFLSITIERDALSTDTFRAFSLDGRTGELKREQRTVLEGDLGAELAQFVNRLNGDLVLLFESGVLIQANCMDHSIRRMGLPDGFRFESVRYGGPDLFSLVGTAPALQPNIDERVHVDLEVPLNGGVEPHTSIYAEMGNRRFLGDAISGLLYWRLPGGVISTGNDFQNQVRWPVTQAHNECGVLTSSSKVICSLMGIEYFVANSYSRSHIVLREDFGGLVDVNLHAAASFLGIISSDEIVLFRPIDPAP